MPAQSTLHQKLPSEVVENHLQNDLSRDWNDILFSEELRVLQCTSSPLSLIFQLFYCFLLLLLPRKDVTSANAEVCLTMCTSTNSTVKVRTSAATWLSLARPRGCKRELPPPAAALLFLLLLLLRGVKRGSRYFCKYRALCVDTKFVVLLRCEIWCGAVSWK